MSKPNTHYKRICDIPIPRDTLGNALPFPVPSGKICRLKPNEWEGMWIQLALGTLPPEFDCSICGEYFQHKEVFRMDRSLIHPAVQRQALNTTLSTTRICRGCKSHCENCKRIIPKAQKKMAHDLCHACASKTKTKSKTKMH
jgi:hypothetical protein